MNASVDGTDILYKKDINIGVAVALDWGLIVPVLKNADQMSLLDISKGIADLAARARDKKLKPEDVQGGTFTITNPGVFGALFGMPIISQPQVAIVGVGAVEKRPVVLNDADHHPAARVSDHRLRPPHHRRRDRRRVHAASSRRRSRTGIRPTRSFWPRRFSAQKIQAPWLPSLCDDLEPGGREHRPPALGNRAWMMCHGGRSKPHPAVHVHNRQQKLSSGLQHPRRIGERLRNVAAGQVIDRGHAYCGVEFGVAKRQLPCVTDSCSGPVRDAGDARIVHQPIWRVALDSEIAAVDVDRGDGHARLCQQQSDCCAAGSGADIDDPADSTGEKPVRHRRQRQIEAEQPMNDHRRCDPPASHEPECDDNRAAPAKTPTEDRESAKHNDWDDLAPGDPPAVAEVIGERRSHEARMPVRS